MIGRMRTMRERVKTEPRPLSSAIRKEIDQLTDEGIPIMREAKNDLKREELLTGRQNYERRSQIFELASLGNHLTSEYIKDSH